MMKVPQVLTILAVAVGTALGAASVSEIERQSNCYDGWEEIPGMGCYLFDTSVYTNWMDADGQCQIQGGHLVEIETQAEQDQLVIRANQKGSYDFFIGLSDLGHEGRYRWLWSGAEAKYFAWGGVDPDGGLGQACALMFGQIPLYDYAWADIGCTDYNAYPLCEMDGYIP